MVAPAAQNVAPATGAPPRRRRLGVRVLRAAVVVSMAIAALELGLRLAGYCTRVAVWYDPTIGFRAYPRQSRWMLSGEGAERIARVHTNELGTRGPVPPRAHQGGVLRVVTLGDSFTFGVGVADDDTYPVQLQRRLAAERPAEVLNLSFPGWNVHNALCAYRELGRRYSPDVVVFGFSMDDMAPTDPGVRYTSNPVMRAIGATGIGQAIIRHAIPRLPGHRREAPAASAELRAAWRAQPLVARRRPDLPRFAGLWESALRDLVALEREVRADGARLLVLVFPRYDQVRDERNGVARGEHFSFPQDYVTRRLQGLDIEFRDLLPALVAAAEEPFGTVEYGHPSEHGYALIGDVAAEALRGR